MNEYRKLDPIDALNKILGDMGYNGNSAKQNRHSYIYWHIPKGWKGTKYQIGYTPWQINCRGKHGFFAVKYRVTKKGGKLAKAVRFGKRKTAKHRAWQWYKQYYEKGSLQPNPD